MRSLSVPLKSNRYKKVSRKCQVSPVSQSVISYHWVQIHLTQVSVSSLWLNSQFSTVTWNRTINWSIAINCNKLSSQSTLINQNETFAESSAATAFLPTPTKSMTTTFLVRKVLSQGQWWNLYSPKVCIFCCDLWSSNKWAWQGREPRLLLQTIGSGRKRRTWKCFSWCFNFNFNRVSDKGQLKNGTLDKQRVRDNCWRDFRRSSRLYKRRPPESLLSSLLILLLIEEKKWPSNTL